MDKALKVSPLAEENRWSAVGEDYGNNEKLPLLTRLDTKKERRYFKC